MTKEQAFLPELHLSHSQAPTLLSSEGRRSASRHQNGTTGRLGLKRILGHWECPLYSLVLRSEEATVVPTVWLSSLLLRGPGYRGLPHTATMDPSSLFQNPGQHGQQHHPALQQSRGLPAGHGRAGRQDPDHPEGAVRAQPQASQPQGLARAKHKLPSSVSTVT